MADEIRNQNVVRITRDGNRWRALIGPDESLGLTGSGVNPASALIDLACLIAYHGYPLDPSWRPGCSRSQREPDGR